MAGCRPCAGCSLTNPFPQRIRAAARRRAGTADRRRRRYRLRRSGRRIGYVHQYSVDLKRELPGRMAASIGYLGSRSERLAVGGTVDARVNINQLDSPIPGARQRPAGAGAESVLRHRRVWRTAPPSPTIPRGELLRPFPQFSNVLRASRQHGARAVQRVDAGARTPAVRRLGRPRELHVQRAQGQPVR